MKATTELAAILRPLPLFWRTQHPILAIQRASRFGYLPCGKAEAARLALAANMEPKLPGFAKGYKAGKRCAKLAEATAVEIQRINDKFAKARAWRFADHHEELRTEGRVSANSGSFA